MSIVVAGAASVGAENAKLALLTVRAMVALAPPPLAVSTSLPALLAVTTVLI
jgi:hypothetical protein